MKPVFLLALVAASVLLSSCCCKNSWPCKSVTLENRRDMYFPQKVNGPYSQMHCTGIPKVEKQTTVTVETTTASYGK